MFLVVELLNRIAIYNMNIVRKMYTSDNYLYVMCEGEKVADAFSLGEVVAWSRCDHFSFKDKP